MAQLVAKMGVFDKSLTDSPHSTNVMKYHGQLVTFFLSAHQHVRISHDEIKPELRVRWNVKVITCSLIIDRENRAQT